mmetsp:Transcript_65653/g.97236  ORF Transcript_65653/g.97236 Transcript_65653/m.97236 type:complete len:218 (-) Transcript_65653:77-730(-)
MFPYINSKNGEHYLIKHSLHEWVILVWCTDKLEFISSLVDADPDPSRSEKSSWCRPCLELCLHFIHRSKRLVNKSLKLVRNLGLSSLVSGGHLVPEEGVVVMSTATVANRTSLECISHKIKNWNRVFSLSCFVDVGNVSSMMLVMVDLHGGSINVWLKSIKIVEEVGDSVCAGGSRSSKSCSEGSTLLKDVASAVDARISLHSHGCRPGSGRSDEDG